MRHGVRALLAVVGCIFALGLGSRPASAVWSHDPAVCVPLTSGAGIGWLRAAVPDGAAGAIAVWQVDGAPVVGGVPMAQHVTSAGVVDWPGNGTALFTATNLFDLHLVMRVVATNDGAGGAIVAFYRQWGISIDTLLVQRVDATGAVLWGSNGVTLGTSLDFPLGIDIAPDGSGGAFIAWTVPTGLCVQRLNAAGVPQWPVHDVALPGGVAAKVVADGSGGVIVAGTIMGVDEDLYVQRMNASGVVQWGAGGQVVCNTAGDQEPASLVSDGAGGAFVAWHDNRGADHDIYVQHVNGSGGADWTANGMAVCTAAGDQTNPQLCTDGLAGVLIAWTDQRAGNNDVYIQRVVGGGVPTGWAGNGVRLGSAAGDQVLGSMLPISGGAIVSWQQGSGSSADLYAQRIDTTAVVQWAASGAPVATASGSQMAPMLVSDLAGGSVVVLADAHTGIGEVVAQHLSADGTLGGDEPYLVSVRDVPNDQGGKVKICWQASPRDLAPSPTIESYWIWRCAPPEDALAALKQGAELVSVSAPTIVPVKRTFLATTTGSTTYYWEYLASQPAGHLPLYSYVARTTSDSLPSSNPLTAFMVQARTTGGSSWWFSNPDSGYSVDNLPPEGLTYLYGVYASGGTSLHWPQAPECDLGLYHLHRGTTPDFVPGPGNLIASKPDTGYFDPGPCTRWYYKLSALDVHGNEGPFRLLTPENTLGVPLAGPPAEFSLRAPNPLRGPAEVHFALPAEGQATLSVFDIGGRQVRRLWNGRATAGPHVSAWDLTDDRGRPAASGVYFARLEFEGRGLTRRLFITR